MEQPAYRAGGLGDCCSSPQLETVEREGYWSLYFLELLLRKLSSFPLLTPEPLLETRAIVESWRAAAGRDHCFLGGENHQGQLDQDHHLHSATFVSPID